MNRILLRHDGRPLDAEIHLEGSKSISNRLLIIQAMAQDPLVIHHLSPSDDTRAMASILASQEELGDVGAAGTTMRFLKGLALSPSREV